MQIGIISDTHDNIQMVQAAQKKLKELGIKTVIHCGDFTEADVIDYLGEFQLYCVYGNGDYPFEIDERVNWFRPDNLAGEFLELTIDNKHIFVTHGHRLNLLQNAIMDGKYDYVIHGHTHQFKDEFYKKTRLINPGALGGKKVEARSFVVLDLETDYLQKITEPF